MLNELSLFSGICGFTLGGKLAFGNENWRTIGYVEWDNNCQALIRKRIADKLLDDAPIFGDIQKFNEEGFASVYRKMAPRPLIITGGFPCPGWSGNGKKLGEADARNMWPATIQTIRKVRPEYVMLENVPGLLTFDYIRTIFGEMAEAGYDCRWHCVSAAAVGAWHKRERLWVVCTRTTHSMGNTNKS